MAKNAKISDRKRTAHNPKLIMICLILMAVFIAELYFNTWCRVQYRQTNFEISKLEESNTQLSALQDNLKIELARLKSPRRISKIAREKLGLISPGAKQTVVMPQP